jgi:hypothetical protein
MTRLTLTLVLLALCGTALGVGTSTWTHTTEADFAAGTPDQVVATNLGDLKLSRAVKTLLEQDPQVGAVYALAEGPDGTVYAGTGPNGILLRIAGGVVSRVATLDKATNVQCLLVEPDGGLLAGTVGEAGKVFRVADPKAKEPAVAEMFKADGVQYVWAMARAGDGTVYAATGPNGQLFAVAPDGTQKVLFDCDENNLTAMAWDGRDKLYVGTDPNGLLYRVDRKTGESFVLYDAGEAEISAVLIDPKGDIFLATGAAQEGPGAAAAGPAGEAGGRPEGSPAGGAIGGEAPKDPVPPKLPEPTPGQPKPIPKVPQSPKVPESPTPEAGAAGIGRVGRTVRGRLRPDRASWLAKPQAAGARQVLGNRPATVMLVAGPPTASGPSGGSSAAPAAPKPPAPAPKPPPTPGPKPGPGTQPAGPAAPPPAVPLPEPGPAAEGGASGNAVYRIDRDGFVTEVFRLNLTIFALVEHDGALLIATGAGGGGAAPPAATPGGGGAGGQGQIFQLRPDAEETVVVARVEPKQVTALMPAKDGNVYLGLANAGGVAAMSSGYAARGTFVSPVMDAGQISRFGKLRLNGSLPDGTALTVATRSGNVRDAAERGWSPWSAELPAAQYTQVPSPAARFLQYRLTFAAGKGGAATPVVEDVGVAYQVPNLPPTVRSVKVVSPDAPAAAPGGPVAGAALAGLAIAAGEATPPAAPAGPRPPPSHKLNVSWEAADPNGDALSYTVAFRLNADGPWVPLKEKTTDTSFEWDTRTVGDGRYQVRVVATDAAANVAGAGKSAARVSDAVVVDNTPPAVGDLRAAQAGKGTAHVSLRVVDRSGTVASADYAVDSSRDWQAFLPSDTIWDSPEETASFDVAGLTPGAHQIAVRAADSSGNVAYETAYVTVSDLPSTGKASADKVSADKLLTDPPATRPAN